MKLLTLTSLLLATATLAWAVPSQINYQGRLTDANGDAITGIVPMSLKMYDAPSGGNELYSENIGSVSLDDNGVYSFQFGADGQSVIDVTDTIAVADGTATTFTGSVSRTPLSGSLSVADGTNSWNIVDGNPGVQATASATVINGFVVGVNVNNPGRGYVDPPAVTFGGMFGSGAAATAEITDGAVTAITVSRTGSGYRDLVPPPVTIAPPPTPYRVDYSAETVSVTYESAPTAGTEIVASYEANDSSIVGALSAADAHWLEISVNAAAQSPRERVLSVPFAQVAGYASNDSSNDRIDILIGKIAHLIPLFSVTASANLILDTTVASAYDGSFNFSETLSLSDRFVRYVSVTVRRYFNRGGTDSVVFSYKDGTTETISRYWETENSDTGTWIVYNPNLSKEVSSFSFSAENQSHELDGLTVHCLANSEQSASITVEKPLTAGEWILGIDQSGTLLGEGEYVAEFLFIDNQGQVFAAAESIGQRIIVNSDVILNEIQIVWSPETSPIVVTSINPIINSISLTPVD